MSAPDGLGLAGWVHVVDDDDGARSATARLMKAAGYEVRTYTSADAFLAVSALPGPACAILDLRMPAVNGLELQQCLVAWPDPPAVVFVSAHGQVADAVKAMQGGAVDFLTKPVEPTLLLAAVRRALARDADDRGRRAWVRSVKARYQRLTPREREVLPHLVAGQLNKQIAFDLGTAERTIKIHRARILEKMEANSIAELVRLAAPLGVGSDIES